VVSLDTNILFYAADKSAGARHIAAHGLVTAATGVQAGLTEQSLIEFLNATTRKTKLSLDEAAKIVRGYMTWFSLLVPHAAVVEDTLALLERHRLEIWDARLLAVCAAHGCDYLLSEDLQDGAIYGAVQVIDPFAPKNGELVRELLKQ